MHTVQDVGGCSELKRGLQPHSQSRRTANALLQFTMEAKGPRASPTAQRAARNHGSHASSRAFVAWAVACYGHLITHRV